MGLNCAEPAGRGRERGCGQRRLGFPCQFFWSPGLELLGLSLALSYHNKPFFSEHIHTHTHSHACTMCPNIHQILEMPHNGTCHISPSTSTAALRQSTILECCYHTQHTIPVSSLAFPLSSLPSSVHFFSIA